MESGFLEPTKRPECNFKMNFRDVDFEYEKYVTLAGHGDGCHIGHVENFRFFLQIVRLFVCLFVCLCGAP
jgi:hypothetical protein